MISGLTPHVSSGTLKNAYDRRSLVIGGLQAAVGLLLAGRVAWIAWPRTRSTRSLRRATGSTSRSFPPGAAQSSIAMVRRLRPTAPISALTWSRTGWSIPIARSAS